MKAILFTSTKCPNCPRFRRLLRETANELGMKEGVDFVEKLIDGDRVTPGAKVEIDGEDIHIVASAENIKETPAAIGGKDLTIEALRYQIASTPALVVDGEPAFVGEVPTKEKLLEALG
jgi:glutaredoxin-related protein